MAQAIPADDATDAIKVSDVEPPAQATTDKEVHDFIRSDGASAAQDPPPRSAHKRERVLRAKTLLDGLHAEQRPRRHR